MVLTGNLSLAESANRVRRLKFCRGFERGLQRRFTEATCSLLCLIRSGILWTFSVTAPESYHHADTQWSSTPGALAHAATFSEKRDSKEGKKTVGQLLKVSVEKNTWASFREVEIPLLRPVAADVGV